MENEETTIRPFLYDLAQHAETYDLPNHDPTWGFKSRVHEATGESFSDEHEIVPVRFSRTASDGNPIRSFDSPFPAVDTATIWGFAQGNVRAERRPKDRENGEFVRNPKSKAMLWRIKASRLRAFTVREYARLQTFPDDWEFVGDTKRSFHVQVGNAVPVAFAERFAATVREALSASDEGRPFVDADGGRPTLF